MVTGLAFRAAERGLLPDFVVRRGIRRLLRERLRSEERGDGEARQEGFDRVLGRLREGPIAVDTDAANRQHYELPATFFEILLGPRLKYSCGLWGPGVDDLAASEAAMLRLTCERAGIEDGMRVLDLGCGWGSLSLWIAERFPSCRILAVSNSESQREFIETACRERGLTGVRVATADMNDFDPAATFDRVVSVEMFEHMRNWERLLDRIAGWLVPQGRLFVHVFCHRRHAYLFEADRVDDWMARYFFSGGLMPSDDLLLHFQRRLAVSQHWRVGGEHYRRTLMSWLARLDDRRDDVRRIFVEVYGEPLADVWVERWRLFLLASAELFGYRRGEEWSVSHYLMERREARARGAS